MADPVAADVNLKAVAWGAAFRLAGLAVALGWIGSAWAFGPRIGAATALLVCGFVLVLSSFAAAIRGRTERLDGKGSCPVGATCGCGHFNFKPSKVCRQCGAATLYV